MKRNSDCHSYVFRSAVSLSFYLYICIAMVAFLSLLALTLTSGSMYAAILVSSPCLAIAGAFPLIYYRMRYIVTDDELIIRFPGLSDEHISLKSIVSFKKVYDVMTAKALSTDRIEIKTDKNYCVYISPDDADKFIDIIKSNRNSLPNRTGGP